MWGLPDGLEFCPHDSFEVDVRSGLQLARRIRFKPNFLAALPSGEWKVEALSAPWDWAPSISPDDLRTIAHASKNLATKLNRSVVIMWFAGVLPSSGHPRLIPWRYTTEDAPRQIESAVGSHFRTRPYYLRNADDIKNLGSASTGYSSVVFRPDGPHLRSENFLEQLGNAVKQLGLRVDLEGSPLSHAFYVLKRTGAHVGCVDPINPQAVKLRFEKLVRDRIPIQIRRHGETAETFVLPKDELVDVLKRKLVEEGLEVLAAGQADSLREEIADVYEVIRALCRALGCTVEDVQRDADRKKRQLGGFGSGIVLVETEDTPLIFLQPEGGLFEKPRSRKITPTPNSIAAAGRRLKTQAGRVVVPLVPPAPSRVRGASRIELRHFGLTVRVKYQDKAIEVLIEPTASEDQSGANGAPA